MQQLELDPKSRSHRLRELFWCGAHESYCQSGPVFGTGDATLVGKASDFQALLEATPAVMQPEDLLAGVRLIVPAEGSSIDLGEYDGHYTPGHANILRLGLTGIRDRAREKLADEADPEKRDFLEAAAIAYEAARQFAEKKGLV